MKKMERKGRLHIITIASFLLLGIIGLACATVNYSDIVPADKIPGEGESLITIQRAKVYLASAVGMKIYINDMDWDRNKWIRNGERVFYVVPNGSYKIQAGTSSVDMGNVMYFTVADEEIIFHAEPLMGTFSARFNLIESGRRPKNILTANTITTTNNNANTDTDTDTIPAIKNNPSENSLAIMGWKSHYSSSRGITTSIVYTTNEFINGQLYDVMSITPNIPPGTFGRYAGIINDNASFIQLLKTGSGVRFKVLGDGKNWNISIGLTNIPDEQSFYTSFNTKLNNVETIDVPFSQLKNPNNANRNILFNNNNIKYLTIYRIYSNDGNTNGGTGETTIKIFDFEVY